jgi:hypothetical protein
VICGGPGSDGNTLPCFAYPNERFKYKPHFVAATFFVSEIQAATIEKSCLKGSPSWLVINSKEGMTAIHHVIFKTFEIGDNWMSGGQSGPVYRTFHAGKCYELGIQILQRRTASEPTLKEIYDVYITPDGRVEGEDQASTNALEGARSILRQHEKTENGLK